VVDEVVTQRGVQHARGVKLLARYGGTDDGEDARADDGADSERGKRPGPEGLFEPVLGFFRFANELIDGLASKQLAWQGSSPSPFRRGYRELWETLSGSVHDGDWTSRGGSPCGGTVAEKGIT
jgi:hypothetical protein